MRSRKTWRPQLSAGEQRGGWVLFALYLLVFPVLMPGIIGILDARFDLYLSIADVNLVYYIGVAILVIVTFREFLSNGVSLLDDWLPENLVIYAAALAGWGALRALLLLLPLPVDDPSVFDYAQQYMFSPAATVMIAVILRPIVEEILFRGLIFGCLRKNGRILAYIASIVLYTFACVWQFAFPGGGAVYLLLGVLYLPAALALTWSYDRGGSIWTPVLLRITIEGITLALIVRGGVNFG